MKNKKIILGIVFLGMMLVAAQVLAANTVSGLELAWPPSPLSKIELREAVGIPALIQYLYEWLIGLGGLAVFVVLVYSGFDYLTSAGDSRKMKDALARIRNAFLGLALLLGSFLILNTINPQLTTLKMPVLPSDTKTWERGSFTLFKERDCESAMLFSNINYGEPVLKFSIDMKEISSLDLDENPGDLTSRLQIVRSVRLEGNCQLILYNLDNFEVNKDNPPIVIMSDIENLESIYSNLNTSFGSAKIIDASREVCPSLACLYSQKEFQENILLIEETKTLENTLLNNQASAVAVKNGYALILTKDSKLMSDGRYNLTGECLMITSNIPDLDLGGKLGKYNWGRVGNNEASGAILFKLAENQEIKQNDIILCGNDNCSMDKGSDRWQAPITRDTPSFNYSGQLSAIKFNQPNYVVILYNSKDYNIESGKETSCRVITKDINLGEIDFNDQTSSIQVRKIEEKVGGDTVYPY